MKRLLCGLLIFIATASMAAQANKDGSQIQPDNLFPRVKIVTNFGTVILELDRYKAPITTNNFLRYVAQKSYDNTIFHRIVAGFVVQGGGYDKDFKAIPTYPPIFNESGNGNKNDMYTVAMARQNDPHSATSQFFFNLNDNKSLNPGKNWGYAVFGVITDGMDVVDKMGEVETHYDAKLGWRDVPVKPVMLIKATILPQQKK